jgi:3-deoxy-manno-octulosonate cytidylyltransferase (CMP-KDO synthetase)
MNIIALIPARLESTRFPKKMLAKLNNGQSVILTTYLNAINTELFNRVYVVTNSKEIRAEIKSVNGRVIYDPNDYACGTDRIAAVVNQVSSNDNDIIINVQGDEPIMNADTLERLIGELEAGATVASVQVKIDAQTAQNPNIVKVLTDKQNEALCFSRAPVPYQMDETATYWRHLGAYGFKKWALEKFTTISRGPIERAESIEAIRFLEACIPLKMVNVEQVTVGVDMPEDLERVNKILMQND